MMKIPKFITSNFCLLKIDKNKSSIYKKTVRWIFSESKLGIPIFVEKRNRLEALEGSSKQIS